MKQHEPIGLKIETHSLSGSALRNITTTIEFTPDELEKYLKDCIPNKEEKKELQKAIERSKKFTEERTQNK